MTKLGLQRSTTHAVDVRIYPHADDTILPSKSSRTIHLSGKTSRDAAASVVSVNTNKALGSPDGDFTVTVKEPLGASPSLKDIVLDDDWIDIEWIEGSRAQHGLRGLVERVSFDENTSGEATERTITIAGKDLGSIFRKTPIWFNQFNAEIADVDIIRFFESSSLTPTPDEAVPTLLRGFLASQHERGRVDWIPPLGVSGRTDDVRDVMRFVTRDFDPDPLRRTLQVQMGDLNNGGLWEFVTQYADPMFCEFFVDLVRKDGSYLEPGTSYTADDTALGVVFRTRPFPRFALPLVTQSARVGRRSPWFSLPTATVRDQEIEASTLGRGGMDRFNAFFVASDLLERSGTASNLIPPMWNPSSIRRHGMKQLTVQSRYYPVSGDPLALHELRWQQLCWHALNAYLLSGTLTLGRLRPDIRVGQRLVIPRGPETVTLYVEQVNHSWSLGSGTTMLGVTRGWEGSDDTYLRALEREVAKYEYLPGSGAEPISAASADVGVG